MKTVRKFKVKRVHSRKPPASSFQRKIDSLIKQLSTDTDETVKALVSPEFHHLLGMTSREVHTMISDLSVVGRLMLMEALATELRRINSLMADGQDPINGPNAQADLTGGEARVFGIGKELGSPGAASDRNVQQAADAVAFLLEVTVAANEELARTAPVRDGEISDPRGRNGFPLSRPGQHMTLDQLSKFADRQNAMNAQLRSQTDLAGALGVSKASLEAERRVAKEAGQPLPADSYAGAAARIRRP